MAVDSSYVKAMSKQEHLTDQANPFYKKNLVGNCCWVILDLGMYTHGLPSGRLASCIALQHHSSLILLGGTW